MHPELHPVATCGIRFALGIESLPVAEADAVRATGAGEAQVRLFQSRASRLRTG